MTCHRAPEVHPYHDGELSLVQRRAVEAHLAECEPCSNLLSDLREISLQIRSAPLPEVSALPFERLYNTWHAAREQGVLRITRWLTAAAAAILVGSLLVFPGSKPSGNNDLATVQRPSWEPVALMAPVVEDPNTTRGEELVEVAQWMADDLATN